MIAKWHKMNFFDIFPREVVRWSALFAYLLWGTMWLILWGNRDFWSANALFFAVFWAVCCTAFFIIVCSMGNKLAQRTLLILLGGTAMAWTLIDSFCVIQLRSQIVPAFVMLLRGADGNECGGFLDAYLFSWRNLYLLLYPAAGWLVFLLQKRYKYLTLGALSFLLPLLWSSLFAIPATSDASSYALRTLPDRFYDTVRTFVEAAQNDGAIAEANSDLQVKFAGQEAVYVVVIGESHAKWHSQLYGYPRPTNPKLSKRRAAKELYVFQDAVSPHSFTMYALPKLLTLEAHDRSEAFFDLPNIFDLAKAAGFKTWWICNQPLASDQAMPNYSVIKRADQVEHPSANGGGLDGILPPLLGKLLQDPAPRKLIVLQLTGSHHEYDATYPADFAYFAPNDKPKYWTPSQKRHSSIINSYDNSLRYNDYVLDRLMSELAAAKKPGFLLYVSDHGENLYEKEGLALHMEFYPTYYTAEVPMFLYLTPEYRQMAGAARLAALERAQSRPVASEDLPHILLDLGNFQTPHLELSKSPFSEHFRPKTRIISRCGIIYDRKKR